MIILGIDPGIGRMGWGVIQSQNSKLKSQNYGCLETDPKETIENRLLAVYKFVDSLIKKYKPDALATEELFFNTNTKTAMTVGQARGVVIVCGAINHVPVFSYTPLQVKIAITGYGRAAKGQIGQMVAVILSLPNVPKLDDTTDALAVAIAHANSAKMARLGEAS